MKKLFMYFGIVILLGLVLLPPALRIFLPEKPKETPKIEVISYILSCSQDSYLATTSYLNDKIQIIVLKHNIQEETETETSQEKESVDTSTSAFEQMFSDLKEKSAVSYTKTSESEIISIDFTVSEQSKLNIANLTKDRESQKKYYEDQGFSCIVKKAD